MTGVRVGSWLPDWLAAKRDIRPATRLNYSGHITLDPGPVDANPEEALRETLREFEAASTAATRRRPGCLRTTAPR
ncbi:MAG: hypothetical protein ACRDRE_26115, partial [Pseudonocardiaceae bacterium]